jgi:hypothetical protein
LPPHQVPRVVCSPSTVWVVDDRGPGLAHPEDAQHPSPVCVGEPWHGLVQSRHRQMVCMAGWTLEELDQSRAHLCPRVSAGLLASLLASLLATVGRVPRYVLETLGLAAEGATSPHSDDVFRSAVRRQVSSVLRPEACSLMAADWMHQVVCGSGGAHHARLSARPEDGGDTQGDGSRIGPPSPGRLHYDTQRPCVARRHAHDQLAAAAGWAGV